MTTNYMYKQKHPETGVELDRVGMVTIFDEAEKHRVPEGAIEVGEHPSEEDPGGAFFDAWQISDDGNVTVDIEKAKEIRMKWLRKRRDELLAHLDSVQFRYLCAKNQKAVDSVEEAKNELRDFPAKINWDVISSLHDVKHILPPCLV